ncbi:AAA domain-containing protein [Desulfococcus sp.]|uniref:AAA domain-containing protein n=1 Tax=Desulfococcus sp. TaxID=2025834 RepID=UPI0035940526
MRHPIPEPQAIPAHGDGDLPADILSEYQSALQEEIRAVRRNGLLASLRLKNGRFIDRIGSRFHYAFEMEAAPDLFWDGPADLVIPDQPSMVITLVSTSGLTLTASLPEHKGDRIGRARLHYNLTDILEKWIERLEGFKAMPNPAGERIRGALPVSGAPADVTVAEDLDPHQARAVLSALGHDAAFILSPPGSGKTRTIAEIVRLLRQRNQSVLVASRSARAADRIILSISRRMPASARENGQIIRLGDPDLPLLKRHPNLLLETRAALKAEAPMIRKTHLAEKLRAAKARAARVSRMIDILEWVARGERDLEVVEQAFMDLQAKKRQLEKRRRALKEMQRTVILWREAAEAAKKHRKAEADLIQLTESMATLKGEISDLAGKLAETADRLAEARQIYGRTSSAGWLTRQLRQIPPPEQQKEAIERLETEAAQMGERIDAKRSLLRIIQNNKTQLEAEAERLSQAYPAGRDDILKQKSLFQTRFEPLDRETKRLNKGYHDSRIRLAGLLSAQLKSLNQQGFSQVSGGTPEVVLNAIKAGYANAKAETRGLHVDSLRLELTRLGEEIAAYRADLGAAARNTGSSDHETEIGGMERRIVAEADVVVTTLSNACLHDAVHSRRFDAVILDEVSMAPVPAVWIAAGLAASRIIVLGDPGRLPPAVMSDGDLARKWLGRDVFETAGFTREEANHPNRVMLRRRYLTHPRISALAAEMMPQREAPDGKPQPDAIARFETAGGRSDDALAGWYSAPWGNISPVLMVDTGPSRAWITRLAGPDPSDGLNFMSAALCVSAAKAFLRKDRPPLAVGDDPRVLIIAPYVSHAALVDLLIRQEGLEDDIHAGTPESLYDLRAPVVILDMVEDDPFSGAPVYRPNADAVTRRRISDCLARAQSRLVVVGDFEHLEKRAHGAFTGSRFIPALRKKSAVIQAPDLIRDRGQNPPAAGPDNLSLEGGEADSPRTGVTREAFIEALNQDIDGASERVIVYSPALDAGRLSEVERALRAAAGKRVRVYVITRTAQERRKSEVEPYGEMARRIEDWGAMVIHRMRLAEKLVVIDDRILWFGSFDPLGPPDPADRGDFHGSMERRSGRTLIEFAGRRLRWNELVEARDAERHPRCPICGREIVAAAGRHWPYYWRCIEAGCYHRTIDQPPPAPMEKDALRCARCGGDVEFGYWGGNPCWRCRVNRKHRQPVVRTHLTTPEAAHRIPPRELVRLRKTFDIKPPSA